MGHLPQIIWLDAQTRAMGDPSVTRGVNLEHHEGMVDSLGPGLVGREDSLDLLSAALDTVAGGSPSVVVVAGETGVGKSALVSEFLARSEVAVFAGICVPVAGEPLPYAALSQALRTSRRTGVVHQELTRSPELGRLVSLGPEDPPAEHLTAASSRLRLFQSVLSLLGKLGTETPAVHVIEDVHWADRASLDLLAFLATNLTDERVLLILTYRTEAVAETDTLATWLAELGRLRTTELVRLERLDQKQTTELVTSLTGAAPEPDFLRSTIARSAGNPLFVEQLVLAGDRAPGLPETLHGLLRSRVSSLPSQTRAVLRAAAVIGRVASVPLLARTMSRSVPEVEESLRPAITAHVAEVRGDDRIGFHHPAFGEVVYAELLPGERAALHGAAARALEAVPAATPGVAGEVARHWHRAGDLPRALAASVRAGEASERMFAFTEAQTNYLRAVDLLDEVPVELDRVDLLTRAANCSMLVGDTARAVSLAESALALTEPATARASLHERLGHFHFLTGNGEAALADFHQAIALLPAGESSTLVARVYAGLGLLAASWSWLDVADDACEKALRISREVGARREEGKALNALGIVAAVRGDVTRGVALLQEALAIARTEQDPHDVATGYVNLSHVLGLAGRLDEGVELCRAGIVELDHFGQDRQTGSLLLCNAVDALTKAGRLGEAGELVDDAAARHPQGIIAAATFLMAARPKLAQGDLTEAWDRCEQARLLIEAEDAPLAWLREVLETAAEIELWSGRPEAALKLVTDGLAAISGTDEARFGTGLVALGLRALADDAAVRRDPRSRVRRAHRRDELLGVLARIHADADADEAPLPDAEAQDLLCLAEQARLDEASSPVVWAGVAEAWSAIARPLPAAYASWRHAEALLARGVTANATGVLRATHASARNLEASRLVAELEALAVWYRIDLPAPSDATAGDVDDGLAVYELTSREREVLAALAAGHSNKEIADSLFISVKTASVHVSNILRKLDVPGRQEAARIAHRLGVPG